MMAKICKTPVMVLQELAVKNHYPPPTYEIVYSITGTHTNRFDYKVHFRGVVATGSGPSKQIGKHDAALNALKILEGLGLYDPLEMPVQEFQSLASKSTDSDNHQDPESPFKSCLNCIGPLKDLCLEYKIPDPVFKLLSDVGPPHNKQFTFECKVASIRTVAMGSTKKMAKQLAAKEMLEKVKECSLPNLAEAAREDLRAIETELSDAARTYNEFFAKIIPNKAVPVDEWPLTFSRLMDDKQRSFKDFSEEFETRSEKSLESLLDKLGLTYLIYDIQDDPIIVSLSISCDVPFTTMGLGDTVAKAKEKAVDSAFDMLYTYFQLKQ